MKLPGPDSNPNNVVDDKGNRGARHIYYNNYIFFGNFLKLLFQKKDSSAKSTGIFRFLGFS